MIKCPLYRKIFQCWSFCCPCCVSAYESWSEMNKDCPWGYKCCLRDVLMKKWLCKKARTLYCYHKIVSENAYEPNRMECQVWRRVNTTSLNFPCLLGQCKVYSILTFYLWCPAGDFTSPFSIVSVRASAVLSSGFFPRLRLLVIKLIFGNIETESNCL